MMRRIWWMKSFPGKMGFRSMISASMHPTDHTSMDAAYSSEFNKSSGAGTIA